MSLESMEKVEDWKTIFLLYINMEIQEMKKKLPRMIINIVILFIYKY